MGSPPPNELADAAEAFIRWGAAALVAVCIPALLWNLTVETGAAPGSETATVIGVAAASFLVGSVAICRALRRHAIGEPEPADGDATVATSADQRPPRLVAEELDALVAERRAPPDDLRPGHAAMLLGARRERVMGAWLLEGIQRGWIEAGRGRVPPVLHRNPDPPTTPPLAVGTIFEHGALFLGRHHRGLRTASSQVTRAIRHWRGASGLWATTRRTITVTTAVALVLSVSLAVVLWSVADPSEPFGVPAIAASALTGSTVAIAASVVISWPRLTRYTPAGTSVLLQLRGFERFLGRTADGRSTDPARSDDPEPPPWQRPHAAWEVALGVHDRWAHDVRVSSMAPPSSHGGLDLGGLMAFEQSVGSSGGSVISGAEGGGDGGDGGGGDSDGGGGDGGG
ncbi:MAG: DUF2207 domain-containing protein [Actinomycetota bacterium]|nr:DUF2207 domain-containing protein [Actinomycetota bacterium]